MKKKKRYKETELRQPGGPIKKGSGGLWPFAGLLPEEILFGALFLGVMLALSSNLYSAFTLPKLLALRLGAVAVMALWCYRLKKGEVQGIPRVLVYSVSALAGWWVLSTALFAIHLPTALYGVYGRFNGLWTHLLYLILFIAAATLPLKTDSAARVLKIFSIVVIPAVAYAVLQALDLDPLDLPKRDFRPVSFIGNAGSLAAILGLALPFQTAFMLAGNRRNTRVIWACIAAFTALGILLTLSRAVFFASGIALAVLLIPYYKTQGAKAGKILAWAAACVVVACAVVGTIWMARPGGEALSRFRPDMIQQQYQGRLLNQKVALEIVRERPATGIGFENLRNAYPAHRSALEAMAAENVTPTMAHNGYLDILVDNGIPGFILYACFIALCLVLLVKGYRSAPRKDDALLFLACLASLSGYLIQDLFGWREVSSTAFYWILLGIGVGTASREPGRPAVPGMMRKIGWVFGIGSCLVAAVLAASSLSQIRVDRLLKETLPRAVQRDWRELQSNLEEMVSLDPDNAYVLDGAGVKYLQRFALTGQKDYYQRSATLLQKAHELNTLDAYVLIHFVELEGTALGKGTIPAPSEFARRAVGMALSMDPNNPTIYRVGAQFHTARKEYAEALRLIRRAKELKDDNLDFYIIERDVLKATGGVPDAIDTYRKAIAGIGEGQEHDRKWLRAKLSLAWFLLQDGKSQQALQETSDVIKVWPDQPIAFVIRGAAYVQTKDIPAGKASFEKALKIDPRNMHAMSALQQLGVNVRVPDASAAP